jgi:hypothetical protein
MYSSHKRCSLAARKVFENAVVDCLRMHQFKEMPIRYFANKHCAMATFEDRPHGFPVTPMLRIQIVVDFVGAGGVAARQVSASDEGSFRRKHKNLRLRRCSSRSFGDQGCFLACDAYLYPCAVSRRNQVRRSDSSIHTSIKLAVARYIKQWRNKQNRKRIGQAVVSIKGVANSDIIWLTHFDRFSVRLTLDTTSLT